MSLSADDKGSKLYVRSAGYLCLADEEALNRFIKNFQYAQERAALVQQTILVMQDDDPEPDPIEMQTTDVAAIISEEEAA